MDYRKGGTVRGVHYGTHPVIARYRSSVFDCTVRVFCAFLRISTKQYIHTSKRMGKPNQGELSEDKARMDKVLKKLRRNRKERLRKIPTEDSVVAMIFKAYDSIKDELQAELTHE